ncbi:MAG: glycosyltransferase family 39 protein [Planctomycetes bacterium]|nr:glycosyltransferase family 39 protein [Planctomycetota bacterium]
MSPMLMEEPVSQIQPASTPVPVQPANDLGPRWLAPMVLLGAITIAALVYAFFWQHSLDLWWWMGHDRHTHYMNGLNLALDLRTGDFARLLHDFDRMRVWGPLHPVLVALIQLPFGPDHRLAVLPSLFGWVLAIWCAYLIPRRLLPAGGNAAGLLAAFFVAVSPAHRAYATDVMYESLGAGLSLAALYLYLVVIQDQTRRAAIGLGVTLSALFLHKYNYWILVILGLSAGEFLRQPAAWFGYARSLLQRDRLPTWALAELKHPLNWIALALGAAALVVVVTGGGVFEIAGRTVSIQEPHNLVHLAYIAVFIRLVLWWRSAGREWSLTLPETVRGLLLWHGGVIAVWFLMPKRLSYFLWYLGPNNNDQQRESLPFMHGLPYYLEGLQADYMTASSGLYLLAGMVALGLVAWRFLKPGATAVMLFLLIGTYLTCQHPMLKNRFMHSWIAAAWVVGAIGLVWAAQLAVGWFSERGRPWASAIVCAVLIAWLGPEMLNPGHAQEGGLKTELPSPLRITDTYVADLADAKNPTIVSNVSTRFLWTWTFIEHHRHQNMAAEIKHFARFGGDPEPARNWLATTRSDALVLIDIAPGSTFDWKTKEYVDLTAFHQALAEQSTWTLARRWVLPEGVTITLWKKNRPG